MSSSTDNNQTKFDTVSWDEKPVEGTPSELKITRVRTERKFTGRLDGQGIAEYVMIYHPAPPGVTDPHKMTASYSGLMVFKGTLDGGEAGEITFMTTGTFAGMPDAKWTIDEKTGLGGLKGLKGTGGYGFSDNAKGMLVSLDVQMT